MIIDKLENLKNYTALNPLFGKVVEFIEKEDLQSFPLGKHVIDGDDLFANFNECSAKAREEAKLETHDVMIDIQIPLNDAEEMGYTPRADLMPAPYDAENDISFYEGAARQYFTVEPGMFVIFFPEDAHAPAICRHDGLRKIIFKVKV